jgi:hypothetical protein
MIKDGDDNGNENLVGKGQNTDIDLAENVLSDLLAYFPRLCNVFRPYSRPSTSLFGACRCRRLWFFFSLHTSILHAPASWLHFGIGFYI